MSEKNQDFGNSDFSEIAKILSFSATFAPSGKRGSLPDGAQRIFDMACKDGTLGSNTLRHRRQISSSVHPNFLYELIGKSAVAFSLLVQMQRPRPLAHNSQC